MPTLASRTFARDLNSSLHNSGDNPSEGSSSNKISGADIMAQSMATPMIQCDVPQWTLFGISLAGFNAIFSILGAIGIVALWRRRP